MDKVDQRIHYFDPREDIETRHHVLPHWEQGAVTYFVTFRLADSLPQSKLDQWQKEREIWCSAHPEPWSTEEENEYHKRFSTTIERWLDQGYGACVLRDGEIGGIVMSAMRHFEGDRSLLHSAVVMPNHVHVLFTPQSGHGLAELLHSWKSYTAVKINAALGKQGELWQRAYFDRIIRDGDHFRNCVRYIRRNPEKAGLKSGTFLHHESAWVRGLRI